MNKNKITDIMEVAIFLPDERIVEWLKGDKKLYDVLNLIEYSDYFLYLKDSKEFINFDEVRIGNDFEDIKLEDVILFNYCPNTLILEWICEYGLDEFFEEEILDEWVEYVKKNNNRSSLKSKGIESFPSHTFYTGWHYWQDKSWTDCGYEYDSGMDYIGIIDMNKLEVLKEK